MVLLDPRLRSRTSGESSPVQANSRTPQARRPSMPAAPAACRPPCRGGADGAFVPSKRQLRGESLNYRSSLFPRCFGWNGNGLQVGSRRAPPQHQPACEERRLAPARVLVVIPKRPGSASRPTVWLPAGARRNQRFPARGSANERQGAAAPNHQPASPHQQAKACPAGSRHPLRAFLRHGHLAPCPSGTLPSRAW